jgi:uncharacterized membrane protein
MPKSVCGSYRKLTWIERCVRILLVVMLYTTFPIASLLNNFLLSVFLVIDSQLDRSTFLIGFRSLSGILLQRARE